MNWIKTLFLDLTKHYGTISKYPLETIHTILLNMIKYKSHTTIIKAGNTGLPVSPYWKNICNDKNNNAKVSNFIETTKTNSPTGYSGATILPPIGNSYMYIETSSNNHGNKVFVSFERTNII